MFRILWAWFTLWSCCGYDLASTKYFNTHRSVFLEFSSFNQPYIWKLILRIKLLAQKVLPFVHSISLKFFQTCVKEYYSFLIFITSTFLNKLKRIGLKWLEISVHSFILYNVNTKFSFSKSITLVFVNNTFYIITKKSCFICIFFAPISNTVDPIV